jgi:hypothetical protein
MKRKRSVLLAATGASVLALGALPTASHADVASTCEGLVGSSAGTINLQPLANVNYATCSAAVVPTCGSGSSSGPIDLGVARISVTVCNPL